MTHKAIGVATIKGAVTTIREYENGTYTVEADGELLYSGFSLNELKEKLEEDEIVYSIP